jgi:hypothetical protein
MGKFVGLELDVDTRVFADDSGGGKVKDDF